MTRYFCGYKLHPMVFNSFDITHNNPLTADLNYGQVMNVLIKTLLVMRVIIQTVHIIYNVCFTKIVTEVIHVHLSLLTSTRLKKIQEKKKQLREKTEREMARRLAELGPIAEPSNMVDMEKDEDLLFE